MAKYEQPDPQPVEVPAGFKIPETLEQRIRRLVRSEELANAANAAGEDTFEEAEDFEIDDDMWDPSSPYEEVFDPVLGRGITHDEFLKHEEVYKKRYEDAFTMMVNSDALRARPKPHAEQSSEEPEAPKGQAEPAK